MNKRGAGDPRYSRSGDRRYSAIGLRSTTNRETGRDLWRTRSSVLENAGEIIGFGGLQFLRLRGVSRENYGGERDDGTLGVGEDFINHAMARDGGKSGCTLRAE